VIPTPEFMRGTYGVAGFNPAPAFGTAAWRLLLGNSDSQQLAQGAKLIRNSASYNRYGLMQITIHEAMPGHYVQF